MISLETKSAQRKSLATEQNGLSLLKLNNSPYCVINQTDEKRVGKEVECVEASHHG